MFWWGGSSFCLACLASGESGVFSSSVSSNDDIDGNDISLLSLHYAGVARPNFHPHYQQNPASLSVSPLTRDYVCWYKILFYGPQKSVQLNSIWSFQKQGRTPRTLGEKKGGRIYISICWRKISIMEVLISDVRFSILWLTITIY